MAGLKLDNILSYLGSFVKNTTKEIEDIKSLKENRVLWSNDKYTGKDKIWYPGEKATLNLSETVSSQKNGVILVWSRYEDGEPKNWGWIHNFIPKWQVKNYDGTGINCPLTGFSKCGGSIYKYLYLYDDKLTGHAQNYTDEYAKKFVIRAVLGV